MKREIVIGEYLLTNSSKYYSFLVVFESKASARLVDRCLQG